MLQVHSPTVRHFPCTALAHVRSQFLLVWPPMFDQMLPLPLCLDAYRRSCHAFAARRICYPRSCDGFCKTIKNQVPTKQSQHSLFLNCASYCIKYCPGKKELTATHAQLQARVCSRGHPPVPTVARLCQFFFYQGSRCQHCHHDHLVYLLKCLQNWKPLILYSQFWLGRNSGDPEKTCLLTEIM